MDMNVETEITKMVETKHGVIELRSDNILYFKPDVATFKEYNLQILEELLIEFEAITEGIPRPYLVDNSYITGIINKEEQAYVNANFGRFATRGAMITNSNLIRVMLNSYNLIFKPKVELKLFNSEAKAIEWLLERQ